MGIDLFRDLYGFPSVALQNNIIDLHQDVIEAQCMLRLRSICDTLTEIKNDEAYRSKINQDTNKAVRILKVVTEYVQQYDKDHRVERVRPSLARLVNLPTSARKHQRSRMLVMFECVFV